MFEQTSPRPFKVQRNSKRDKEIDLIQLNWISSVYIITLDTVLCRVDANVMIIPYIITEQSYKWEQTL